MEGIFQGVLEWIHQGNSEEILEEISAEFREEIPKHLGVVPEKSQEGIPEEGVIPTKIPGGIHRRNSEAILEVVSEETPGEISEKISDGKGFQSNTGINS